MLLDNSVRILIRVWILKQSLSPSFLQKKRKIKQAKQLIFRVLSNLPRASPVNQCVHAVCDAFQATQEVCHRARYDFKCFDKRPPVFSLQTNKVASTAKNWTPAKRLPLYHCPILFKVLEQKLREKGDSKNYSTWKRHTWIDKKVDINTA